MKPIYFAFILFLSASNLNAQKINISPDNITNISSWGNAGLLVDEQKKAGDPDSGDAGKVTTRWDPGWTDWHYPASVVVDLNSDHYIEKLFFYDGRGKGKVTFYCGYPGNWDSLYTDQMDSYKTWKQFTVDNSTRYIKVTVIQQGAIPDEIVVYGRNTGKKVKEAEPVSLQPPLMKDFIGINGFIDDPLDVLTTGGFVREYHNWKWMEKKPEQLKFSPSYPGWDFDKYYKTLKDSGVTVCPALQQSTGWIAPDPGYKPLSEDEDSENPASYSEHARYMFQYAARYGSKAVSSELLKLASGQQPKSGLGYLKYFENWNEQDIWWHGPSAFFSPFEYAAMSSADIDGHQGAMGEGYGIKSADPDASLVMGGLSKLNLEYIKAMKLWSDHFRKGDFPADVLNFHHYSRHEDGERGISPEEDSLRYRFAEITDYRDKHLPGKRIWVTEFGYDINSGSSQHAPAIGDFSAEEVQAIWLIRSYLALAAAGVDRAAMYMSRDANPSSSRMFASSGLTEGKSAEFKKKTSWFYLKTFSNLLNNTHFDKEIPSGNSSVSIYQFTEPETSKHYLVLWCPTSDGSTVKDFSVPLNRQPVAGRVIAFENNNTKGKVIKEFNRATDIILTVKEKPLIIEINEQH